MSIQLPSPRERFVNIGSSDQKIDGTLTANAMRFLRTIVAATDSPVVPQYLANSNQARAQFLASNYPNGSIYYESDRGLYYVATGGVWQYLTGVCRVTQAGLPTDLGTSGDVGVLVYVTDYAHTLYWNGTGWEWAPGENGSGYIADFSASPNAPGTGWHLCNGSANVLTLKSDGTLAFATVPNTPGSYYRT